MPSRSLSRSGLHESFARWWETGELPTVEVEGYTAGRLAKERSLNPMAALLTLDWLLREPEAARAAIRARARPAEHGIMTGMEV